MTRSRSGRAPCRLLVTGFGPYPGVPVNPTGMLAGSIARDRRLALAGIEAEAVVFRTTYAGIEHALGRATARAEPDLCLHLGLAPRAKSVRIEILAENRARPLSPDASGRRPKRREIIAGAPLRLQTTVSPGPVLTAVRRAGIPGALSRDAGAYLCNAVYVLSLNAARSRPGRLVLFVHIPRPAPHPGRTPTARVRGRRVPRPAPDGLARALVQVVILLAKAHRTQLRRATLRDG